MIAEDTPRRHDLLERLPARSGFAGQVLQASQLLDRQDRLRLPPRRFLDTQIVPLTVNVASTLEVVLDRASVRTRVRPAVIRLRPALLGRHRKT